MKYQAKDSVRHCFVLGMEQKGIMLMIKLALKLYVDDAVYVGLSELCSVRDVNNANTPHSSIE